MIKEKKLPYNVLNYIENLIMVVKDNKTVNAFCLFGSGSKNTLTPLSDLDFAVLFDKTIVDAGDLFDEEIKIRGIIYNVLRTEEFDLINLNTASKNFVRNILDTGKILYCRDKNQLIDFIDISVLNFLDFSFYREQFLSTFKAKVCLR